MHVEVDDPESDWTREGVFEVDPGVYRIPLPLPHDGLRAVNVYALIDESGLVLIDSGWGIEAARDALDKALAALGRHVRDVHRFLVTHVHRDHYSLAVVLRREFGNQISLGEGERGTIEQLTEPGHRPMVEHMVGLRRCGADPLVSWIESRIEQIHHDPADWQAPDVWLDGSDVALTDRTLTVLPTPGHTQGHVVFIDRPAGLFFAGDHVLPHITPSIGFEAVAQSLPLGNYLASLRLVRNLPDHRLLPAHGPVRPSVWARVDELLAHHAHRLDECQETVGADTVTAFEVANRLTWTRRGRAFTELDPFNQMLAVMETGAHLDLLAAQGRLSTQETAGVVRYAPA